MIVYYIHYVHMILIHEYINIYEYIFEQTHKKKVSIRANIAIPSLS